MSYGKLVVTFDLSKGEARTLESILERTRHFSLGTILLNDADETVVHVKDIEVSATPTTTQFLTVTAVVKEA